MRVLIVEDDPSILTTMELIVKMFGHNPFTSDNVEHATELLHTVKPEVILLDLLMNGNVSTPFIQVARQLMEGEEPRIVVVSAMNEACRVAEENHCGFLQKPFDIYDLKRVIENKNPGT